MRPVCSATLIMLHLEVDGEIAAASEMFRILDALIMTLRVDISSQGEVEVTGPGASDRMPDVSRRTLGELPPSATIYEDEADSAPCLIILTARRQFPAAIRARNQAA